mmetsp:Transcript_33165/g.73179  ORF Transcript_33165/g.73179 Transcript_33165/m.73179 type:complete len:248 (+) Transcript_33165:291-1034(+)
MIPPPPPPPHRPTSSLNPSPTLWTMASSFATSRSSSANCCRGDRCSPASNPSSLSSAIRTPWCRPFWDGATPWNADTIVPVWPRFDWPSSRCRKRIVAAPVAAAAATTTVATAATATATATAATATAPVAAAATTATAATAATRNDAYMPTLSVPNGIWRRRWIWGWSAWCLIARRNWKRFIGHIRRSGCGNPTIGKAAAMPPCLNDPRRGHHHRRLSWYCASSCRILPPPFRWGKSSVPTLTVWHG